MTISITQRREREQDRSLFTYSEEIVNLKLISRNILKSIDECKYTKKFISWYTKIPLCHQNNWWKIPSK